MHAIIRENKVRDKMAENISPDLAELAERLAEDRQTNGKCIAKTFEGQNYCPMLRAPEPDFSCPEAGDYYVSVPEPPENNPFNANRYRICKFWGKENGG